MRYTRYTGLAQVTNWVRLKFAAMNLKKFAIRKWEDTHILLQILIFPLFLSKIDSKPQFCLTQNWGFSTVCRSAAKRSSACQKRARPFFDKRLAACRAHNLFAESEQIPHLQTEECFLRCTRRRKKRIALALPPAGGKLCEAFFRSCRWGWSRHRCPFRWRGSAASSPGRRPCPPGPGRRCACPAQPSPPGTPC